MVYMLKIMDYMQILTDEEVKDFMVINFSALNLREKALYSKIDEERSSIVIEGTSTHFSFFKYPQNTNFLHI